MLRKKFLPSLYALVCVLFIVNCVRDIDFADDKADKDAFVISGSFTNTSGPHRLQFVRPDNYEGQFYRGLRGAKIELHDDLGNVYPYQEVVYYDKREYWLENVTGEVGRTYWLEINYNGIKIRSKPEKMLEPLPGDEVIFESALIEESEESGTVTLKPKGYVYANSVIPQATDDRCIRWETEYVYIVEDRPCPTIFGVVVPSKQCFVRNLVGGSTLGIANPKLFKPGTQIKVLCSKRNVDLAFSKRCAINLYKRTISLDAYNYWSKVQQLLSPTGTVFDAPPGRIYGNLEVVSGQEVELFGWFEVNSTSVTRVFKSRADLNYDVASSAENPCFLSNNPCGANKICQDCLDQPYSTLETPDWWR